MSRRDNVEARCTRCQLHLSLCMCAELPSIVTRSRVVLLIHHKEQRKPTNTGRLALECLQNSECWVRGRVEGGADHFSPQPGTLPLLLFPSDDARPLSDYIGSALPVTLIVPDGNWRQASKFRRRVQGLSQVPTVILPPGVNTRYRLRHEPRKGGLATLEAIARALGLLENDAVEAALMRVFSCMVERTLWSRGAIDAKDVDGGLPSGAVRHDPLSGAATQGHACPSAAIGVRTEGGLAISEAHSEPPTDMSSAMTSNSQAVHVAMDGLTMTIDPTQGARILSFALDGHNILLEAPAVAGTDNANNFGATFWPSPQSAWGWPPIAELDSGPYAVSKLGDDYVLTSKAGRLLDGSSLQLTKTIAMVSGQAAIDVSYAMTNVGKSPTSLAGWQIARVRAGGLTFFRLGEGGVSGDKLATVTREGVQWYAYDAAVVVAQGQKTFADATGWLAHVEGDLVLIQAFPDLPMHAAAPGEAEVELYADPSHTYVEIEPQGRLISIEPGQRAEPWTVRWWLRRLPANLAKRTLKLGDPELVAYVEAIVRT